MAANPLVDLVIKIRGDNSSATASMQELGQVAMQTGNGLSGISGPAQTAATSLTMLDREGRKFIEGLRDQAATIGMSRLEIAEYRAAQLGMAAEAAPLIARLKEVGASMTRTGAEAVGLGESEAEASARLKEMVARSIDAQRALNQTANASRDAASGADALGASGAQVSATIAAQNKGMVDAQRATMLMNDEMQALRTTLAQGNATFATLGEQYSRLDRAMATGKLSMEEYDAALAAIGQDEDKRLQSLNTLTSKYDPLGAATRKLAGDQALLDDAYKSGQLTTAQYQQALAGIKADQAVVQLRRLADQEAELRRSFKAGTISSRDYKAALAEIGTNRTALTEIAGSADKSAKAMHGFSLGTNAARREMVVLAHEMATGSWSNFGSSLMVMAEKSNALGLIMSPLGVAVGVTGAAVAGFAVAAVMGARESDQLTKSLKLTGGAAGVTAGGVTQLARALADDTGKSMGVAREALQALISTGEFTGAALALAGEDVVKFAELSGESLEKVVSDYAKMPEGVTKWAVEHNRQLNYMSEADYERIKTLEDAGKTEDALMANLTLLHQHFADEAQEKLGWVESAWRAASKAIKDGWDALKDVGREETPEKRMATIAARQRDRSSGNIPVVFQEDGYAFANAGASDNADFYAAQMEADNSAVAAFAKAQEDANQKAGIRAAESLEKALHSYDKAYQKGEELRKRKAEFVDLFKANPNSDKLKGVQVTGDDAAGYSVSGGLYDNLVADINKRYDEKSRTSHAQGTGNREVASLKADIAARQQQLTLIDQYGVAQSKVSDGDKKVFQIESQLAIAQQDRTGKVSDAQLKEQLGYAKQLAAIEKQIEARTRDGEALKAYTAQVDKWTSAVESEQAALEQDLVLYGTTGEARKLMASQLKFESEARTTIAKAVRDGHPLSEQQQKDLLAEASARGKTVASIQAQRDALAGAQKLREEDERFAADSIFDEQKRADAILAIDAKKWQELIANAGDGTRAQKELTEQYDQWYANQLGKPALDRWRKTVDQIGTDFHDGFLQMLTNGRASWSSFTESLKNTFKTTVADEIYRQFAKPLVISVIANLAGVNSAVAGSGGSSGNNLLGAVQNGSSLFNNGSSLYNTVAGWFGGGYGAAGSALGASAVAGAGSSGLVSGGATLGGLGAAGAGSYTSGLVGANGYGFSLGGSSGGLGLGSGLGSSAGLWYGGAGLLGGLAGGALFGNKGFSDIGGSLGAVGGLALGASSAVGGTAVGASLGSLAGPIGAIAGMALGSLLGSFIGGGETRYGASYATSDGKNLSKFGGPSGGDPASTDIQTQIKSTYSSIQTLADQLGGSVDGLGQYKASYEVSPKKGNSFVSAGFTTGDDWYPDRVDLGGVKDSETVLADFQLQLQRSVISGLQKAGLDAPYASVLQGVDASKLSADDVTALLAQLSSLKSLFDSFKNLGADFDNLKNASSDAQLAVIQLAGGVDAFNTSATFFYQHFTTADQQAADQAKALNDQLSTLGYTGVHTRDQFKSLVESLDLSTDAGQKAYISLLALAPAFDSVASAGEAAVKAAYDSQSQALTSFRDQLASFRQSLAAGDMSELSPEAKYAASRSTYEDLLSKANAGDATAQAGLTSAAQDFLTASKAYNASSSQYQADLTDVMKSIDLASSVADQQLDLMKQQVAGILDVDKSVQTLAQALAAYNSGAAVDGSHATGLYSVPFDGYVAELHKGERVLTAAEANQLDTRSSSGRVVAPAALDLSKYQRTDNDAVVRELKAQREQNAKQAELIAKLLSAQLQQADAVARNDSEKMDQQTALLQQQRRPGQK